MTHLIHIKYRQGSALSNPSNPIQPPLITISYIDILSTQPLVKKPMVEEAEFV